MDKKIEKSHKKLAVIKAMIAAGFGAIGLFVFYYIVLFLVTKDPIHPINQMKLYQPWMSLLILGFGIQVGLFYLSRSGVRFRISRDDNREVTAIAGTGAAVSGVSMAACCAHHIAEIIPILGISGAALFLTEYQQEFLIFGVVANGLGIAFMIWMLFGRKFPKIDL